MRTAKIFCSVAETVLLTIGWLFLLNGMIDLMQKHVTNSENDAETHHADDRTLIEHKQRNVKWVKYLAA